MGDSELARIQVPTMFYWGRDDPFLSPQQARPSVAKIPGARLHEVAGGHAPWFEDPVDCATRINDHQRAGVDRRLRDPLGGCGGTEAPETLGREEFAAAAVSVHCRLAAVMGVA